MMQVYNKISESIVQGFKDQKIIRFDKFTYDIHSHTFFTEGIEVSEAKVKEILDQQIKETYKSQQF